MYRNYIVIIIVLLTVVFNCFLTFGLMWNPYTLYFDTPEFSTTPFKRRDNYAYFAAVINFIILLLITIAMIMRFVKTKKLLIISPLFSGLTFYLLMHVQTYYPNSEKEYTVDGYQYLEQRWYLNGNNVFKKFRSEKPLSTYSDHRTIVWNLDSLYEE